ncbi:helix-turn-helix domain-containing protein [Streptomyces sp. NBC_01724]|uniref:helix-turn-helix domain-containing protein n=1 Tax=Streptomyces sp. NBC_01724 TaxID=2975922 RepID=UPI003FCEBFBE
MGRRERPIVTNNKALRVLTGWLREQRLRAGQPTYRELAEKAGCHATTLQRAASGDSVPRLPAVLAYARACDASRLEAKRLWKQARHEETQSVRSGRRPAAPPPELVRDFADMCAVLQDLYEKAGSPPLRKMETEAGTAAEYGPPDHQEAGDAAQPQTVPGIPSGVRGARHRTLGMGSGVESGMAP